MPRHVVLLRAVNVGGRALSMAALRVSLEVAGYRDVVTYIQSGNVVFSDDRGDSDEIARSIDELIESEFGLGVDSVVIDRAALAEVVARNPYSDVERAKTVHAIFCRTPPSDAAAVRLDELVTRAAAKGSDEAASIDGSIIYLFTPQGFGRSEVAAIMRPGGARSISGTARNWTTVLALLELCGQVPTEG